MVVVWAWLRSARGAGWIAAAQVSSDNHTSSKRERAGEEKRSEEAKLALSSLYQCNLGALLAYMAILSKTFGGFCQVKMSLLLIKNVQSMIVSNN